MYLVKVTHPWHNCSCSLEYATREHEAETSEIAIQIFKAEASGGRFDLSLLDERLADGKPLQWQDRETGKKVVAFRVTHLITVTHRYAEDPDDYEIKVGSEKDAAETFESEVSGDLTCDEVLEALREEGTFQYKDDETGRIFEVRELVGAVA